MCRFLRSSYRFALLLAVVAIFLPYAPAAPSRAAGSSGAVQVTARLGNPTVLRSKLYKVSGTVKNVSKPKVALQQSTAPGSWHSIATTSASGHGFTFTEKAPGKAGQLRLRAAVIGKSGHILAVSKQLDLHVLASLYAVKLNGPFGTPAVRNVFSIAGTVKPATAGAPVILQKRGAAGAWNTIASVPVSQGGRFSFADTESNTGRFDFRVTKSADGDVGAGTSAADDLTVTASPGGGGNATGDRTLRIDVNGDGLTDLVEVTPRGSVGFNIVPLINTGTSYRYGGVWYSDLDHSLSDTELIPADVNGDGKTDLIEVTPRAVGFNVVPLISNGTDAFTYGNLWFDDPNHAMSDAELIPADVNGDGKMDLIEVTPRAVGFNVVPLISNGTDTFGYGGLWYDDPNHAMSDAELIPADVNGDGKTDLVEVTPRAVGFNVVPLISNGTDTFGYGNLWYDDPNHTIGSTQFVPEDVNGDGKTDLVEVTPRAVGFNVVPLISNGTDTFAYGGLWFADSQATIAYGTSTDILTGASGSGSQPTIPAGESAAAANAVAWANRYVNQSGFADHCLEFVREAWAAGNVALKPLVNLNWDNGTYPDEVWNNIKPGAGTTGTGEPTIPGALVFYAAGPGGDGSAVPSHVQIFVGNDTVVSTEDHYQGKLVVAVHTENFGAHPRELGWWLPPG